MAGCHPGSLLILTGTCRGWRHFGYSLVARWASGTVCRCCFQESLSLAGCSVALGRGGWDRESMDGVQRVWRFPHGAAGFSVHHCKKGINKMQTRRQQTDGLDTSLQPVPRLHTHGPSPISPSRELCPSGHPPAHPQHSCSCRETGRKRATGTVMIPHTLCHCRGPGEVTQTRHSHAENTSHVKPGAGYRVCLYFLPSLLLLLSLPLPFPSLPAP